MPTKHFLKILAASIATMGLASAVYADAPYRVLLSNGGGTCLVGNPDASGMVSGTCTDPSGKTFDVSGKAVAQSSTTYNVTLSSNSSQMVASLSFNTAAQMGSGSWQAGLVGRGSNAQSGSVTVMGSTPDVNQMASPGPALSVTSPSTSSIQQTPIQTSAPSSLPTGTASETFPPNAQPLPAAAVAASTTPIATSTASAATTGTIQAPTGLMQTSTGQNLAATVMSTAGVTCPAGTVQDPNSWTACDSTTSAYVTGGQYAKDLAALNANLQAQSSNPSYSGKSMSYGGASAVANAGFTQFASNVPLSTSAPVGTVTIPFTMSDGSGTGTCVYNASQPGGINAGTGYDLSGTCTTPSGQTFKSTGTAAVGIGGQPGQYTIQAGLGSINSGPFGGATLMATLDTNTGAVSGVSVNATEVSGSNSTPLTLATGSGGSSSVVNPYGITQQSTIVPVTLSDGSTCTVAGNSWYGSGNQGTLIAKCTSPSGTPFTLTGKTNGSGSNTGFDLHGNGPTGTYYSLAGTYDPATGQITQSGGTSDLMGSSAFGPNNNPLSVLTAGNATNGSSAPFHLSFSGTDSGACGLGEPDAQGNISGTCVDMHGVQFPISGTAKPAGPGAYSAALSGEVNNVAFSANVAYDNVNNTGAGNWTTQDGGGGSVSVIGIAQ